MSTTGVFKLLMILLAFSSFGCCSQQCSLPLIDSFNNVPLVFSSNATLLPVKFSNESMLHVNISSGDRVILSCYPNYFYHANLSSTKWTLATCKNELTLTINGVEKNWISDLRCRQAQLATVNPVNQIIAPVSGCFSGSSVQFVYPNPVRRKTIIFGEACYSETQGRTIFIHTRHAGNHNFVQIPLKTEILDFYLLQQHPDQLYQTDFQTALNWYKNGPNRYVKQDCNTLPKVYIEKQKFLKPEFFANGQFNELMYMGWNMFLTTGVHLPNLDLLLRDIADIKWKNFDLFIGTHSILSYKNDENRTFCIYLLPDERKYPVPKYIWVAVKTESRRAVGFLILNDVNASEEDVIRAELCESKCMKMNWLINLLNENAHSTIANGYVWCCELNDFAKRIREFPKLDGKYKLLT